MSIKPTGWEFLLKAIQSIPGSQDRRVIADRREGQRCACHHTAFWHMGEAGRCLKEGCSCSAFAPTDRRRMAKGQSA